jgi:hypothetical protein
MQVKYFILTENMKSQPKFTKSVGDGERVQTERKHVLETNREEVVEIQVSMYV